MLGRHRPGGRRRKGADEGRRRRGARRARAGDPRRRRVDPAPEPALRPLRGRVLVLGDRGAPAARRGDVRRHGRVRRRREPPILLHHPVDPEPEPLRSFRALHLGVGRFVGGGAPAHHAAEFHRDARLRRRRGQLPRRAHARAPARGRRRLRGAHLDGRPRPAPPPAATRPAPSHRCTASAQPWSSSRRRRSSR